MLEYEEALAKILATVRPLAAERTSLLDAAERVTAEDVVSHLDVPIFDNSAMDGYAVRSEDVVAATRDTPIRLTLIGRATAGKVFEGLLAPRTCVRVFTGSALPLGADAVVMQEDTEVAPGRPDEVSVLDCAKPLENVRFKGEDIRAGSLILPQGEVLGTAHLGMLAAVGLAAINVVRRPIVGLLATGSELREPGQSLSPGQIYESNRVSLAALIRQAGGVPLLFPIVADHLEETGKLLLEAFAQCDALITCGGVSVGEMDFVKSALQDIGGDLTFWKIAMKPGRPFLLGRFQDKPLFGLPGNPISALVAFLMLVRPALRRFLGASKVGLPSCPGVLLETVHNPDLRRQFMRVQIDAGGKVRSSGPQASHLLSSLASSNALLDLPQRTKLEVGAKVSVLRWC